MARLSDSIIPSLRTDRPFGHIPGNKLPGYDPGPSGTKSDVSLTGQQTAQARVSRKADTLGVLEDEDENEGGVVNGGKLDSLPVRWGNFLRKICLHYTNQSTKLIAMRREGDTRQKLLRTAIELVWENSYGSISVDDICERAGVNKGSFYYAFKTKSDLAVAAFEEHSSKKRPIMDRIFSSQDPPLVRLAHYCEQTVNDQLEKYQSFGRVLGCPFASVGCELSTQDEAIRQKTEQVAERVVRYLTGAIRDAAEEGSIKTDDPAQLAKEAYCFVVGILMQAKIQNNPEMLERLKPGLARILGTPLEVAQPA